MKASTCIRWKVGLQEPNNLGTQQCAELSSLCCDFSHCYLSVGQEDRNKALIRVHFVTNAEGYLAADLDLKCRVAALPGIWPCLAQS